jgi:hypothetical protein
MSSTCTPSPDRDDEADFDEVGSDIHDVETETWMVFVDPEAGARASGILALAYRQHLPVRAKETCFGLMLEGERDIIRGFMDRLREEFPAGIYLKRRPFTIADTKVCARTFNVRGFRRAAEQFKFHNRS